MISRRSLRIPFAVSGASLIAGMTLALMPASATPGSVPADNVQRSGGSAFSLTKTLARTFVNDDGSTYEFPANTVTVNASQTRDLRGRQRLLVSWTGAQPSGGRAANPYGENGLQQEYPVVIMQCRGADDPSLPIEKQVRPETCWTGSVAERSQITRSDGEAAWIHDAAAAPGDKDRLSGMTPFPGKDVCPNADAEGLYTHLTPFVSAAGKVYAACDGANMPPEAAVGAAFPPAEIAAYSDEDGAGSVQFEVRSDVENESLGCNHKVACTIEVIPINGISCDQPTALQSSDPPTPSGSSDPTASPTASPTSDPPTGQSISDSACRKGGQFPPGSSNFANQGVDQAVAPVLWWSASNWANRFTIPITFGLPPDACDVLDPRAPTGFYGSELMAQASLQWAPAYCLSKKRFKFQLNQMSDAAGWNLMESGAGPAAFVSSPHRRTSADPVGFAPTAVTGFAIGYNVDRPDNGGEYTDLRLNPRLVAKLLTQSYLGSELGRGHPGIGNNPIAIMNDPEFIALNPGLSQISQEAGASLLSLANDSDIIQQLTDWIAHDDAAMDFINGKADPWGMKVNPSYKKIKLPRSEWPLLDTYIPTTNNTCRQNNPDVYFSQLAAPVTTLRKVSDALLDGWPNVQTRCEFDQVSNTYKLGRIDRQSYGARFMLGVVSLGDAARYGLHAAALQTKKGTYVAPDDDSLAAAVDLMQPQQPQQPDKGGKGHQDTQARRAGGEVDVSELGRPFVLDQADIRKSGEAYPGTMVVYTAARLQNLIQDDADKVAQFIRTATTEGQQAGPGNGELPGGFLPIEKKGSTRKLFDLAQEVAMAVAAQVPEPTEEPSPTSNTDAPTLPANTGDSGNVGDVPGGDVPTDVPAPGPSASATAPPEPLAMPQTEAVSSDLGDRAVPVLLILGLIGVALTSAVRFFVRPPRGPLP
ncbi:MAG: hypothetical protein QOD98_356 [Nocardioidaceae bacterium]|nr:hypothetical protein [Nocardioidaceae bacterium]